MEMNKRRDEYMKLLVRTTEVIEDTLEKMNKADEAIEQFCANPAGVGVPINFLATDALNDALDLYEEMPCGATLENVRRAMERVYLCVETDYLADKKNEE